MSDAARPRVSIGFPLYQGGEQAERALKALLGQTYVDLELLISDNASTDGSGQRVAELATGDPRVSYRRLEHTVPAAANFAAVLERATGELFMWAAHDDGWETDHVARLVAALDHDKAAAVACAIPADVDALGRTVVRHGDIAELAVPDRMDRLARFIEQPEAKGKANIIYGLFRRQLLVDADALRWFADPSLTDYHAILAVLVRGHLTVEPSLTFRKQLHAADLAPAADDGLRRSTQAFVGDLRTTLRWLDGYRNVLEVAELPADERGRLRRIIRRRRGRELAGAAARFTALAGGAMRRRFVA